MILAPNSGLNPQSMHRMKIANLPGFNRDWWVAPVNPIQVDGVDNDGVGGIDQPGERDGIDNNGNGVVDEVGETDILQMGDGFVLLNSGSVTGAYQGGANWRYISGLQPRTKPGSQGDRHFAIAADPVDPNIVYVGGDRQDPGPNGWGGDGNSVGATDFTGRLFRGDASIPTTPNAVPSPQWATLTHRLADGSAPHADSREIVFDAGGDLIEVDDGGIYRRTDPRSNWVPNFLTLGFVTGGNEVGEPVVIAGSGTAAHGLQTGDLVNLRISGTIGGLNFTVLDGHYTVTALDARTFSVNGTESLDLSRIQNLTASWGSGRWYSLNGDLQVTELHSVAWDSVSHTVLGGAQDTGVHQATRHIFGNFVWNDHLRADGGDVAVDTLTPWVLEPFLGEPVSTRYSSTQIFGGFRRDAYDSYGEPIPNGGVTLNIPTAVMNTLGGGQPLDRFYNPIAVNAVGVTTAQRLAGLSTRLVIGGTAAVFEANNAAISPTGATVNWGRSTAAGNWLAGHLQPAAPGSPPNPPTPILTGAGFAGVNFAALAYGGFDANGPNPDALYVGSGTQVFVRTAAGGILTPRPFPVPAGTVPAGSVTDVVMDPTDWRTAVAVTLPPAGSPQGTPGRVYMTTNAGIAWNDITGTLQDGNLRTVEFIPGNGDNVVLVGGANGVSRMRTSAPSVWTEFGPNLPNAPVWDLDYNAADNVLLAATIGRGAWVNTSIRQNVFQPATIHVTGSNDGEFIGIVTDSSRPGQIIVGESAYPAASIERIVVDGQGGNDTVFIGSLPTTITVDVLGGGQEGDRLFLFGTSGPDDVQVDSDHISINGGDYTYSGVGAVFVNALDASDNFTVSGIPVDVSMTLIGAADSDHFEIGGGNYLANILGPLHVSGGRGTNTLTFDDTAAVTGLSASGAVLTEDFYNLTAYAFSKTDRTTVLGIPVPRRGPTTTLEDLSEIELLASGSTGIENASAPASTISVESVTEGVTVSVRGNLGDDHFRVGGNNYSSNIEGEITVFGGGGRDTLSIGDSAAPAYDSQLYAFARETVGTDVMGTFTKTQFINVFGVPVPQPSRTSRFLVENVRLDALAADAGFFVNGTVTDSLVLNGNAPNNTFHIGNGSLETVHGTVSIGQVNAQDTATGTIVINDQDDTGFHEYDINFGEIIKHQASGNARIQWDLLAINEVTLNANADANQIDVNQNFTASTVINAGGGDDTIRLVPESQSLPLWVFGDVFFDGEDGEDTLEIYDRFGVVDYSVLGNAISSTTESGNERWAFNVGDVEIVDLFATDERNTFNIQRTSADVHYRLHGRDEVDTFCLSEGHLTAQILGPVTIDGGADEDTLRINDLMDEAGFVTHRELGPGNTLELVNYYDQDIYELGATTFQKTTNSFRDPRTNPAHLWFLAGSTPPTSTNRSGLLTYYSIPNITLEASGGTNSEFPSHPASIVQINGVANNVQLTVDGNDGRDTFRVDATGLYGDVTVNGGNPDTPPGDSLYVRGTSDLTADYEPLRNATKAGVVETNGRTITFDGLEPVTIENFGHVTFVTPRPYDNVDVEDVGNGWSRISGTSGDRNAPLPFEHLTFRDVREVTLDAATNDDQDFVVRGEEPPIVIHFDDADDDDTITIHPDALNARGLQTFNVLTGAGDNQIHDRRLESSQPSLAVLNSDGSGGFAEKSIYGTTGLLEIEQLPNSGTNTRAYDGSGQLRLASSDVSIELLVIENPVDVLRAIIEDGDRVFTAVSGTQQISGLGLTSIDAAVDPENTTLDIVSRGTSHVTLQRTATRRVNLVDDDALPSQTTVRNQDWLFVGPQPEPPSNPDPARILGTSSDDTLTFEMATGGDLSVFHYNAAQAYAVDPSIAIELLVTPIVDPIRFLIDPRETEIPEIGLTGDFGATGPTLGYVSLPAIQAARPTQPLATSVRMTRLNFLSVDGDVERLDIEQRLANAGSASVTQTNGQFATDISWNEVDLLTVFDPAELDVVSRNTDLYLDRIDGADGFQRLSAPGRTQLDVGINETVGPIGLDVGGTSAVSWVGMPLPLLTRDHFVLRGDPTAADNLTLRVDVNDLVAIPELPMPRGRFTGWTEGDQITIEGLYVDGQEEGTRFTADATNYFLADDGRKIELLVRTNPLTGNPLQVDFSADIGPDGRGPDFVFAGHESTRDRNNADVFLPGIQAPDLPGDADLFINVFTTNVSTASLFGSDVEDRVSLAPLPSGDLVGAIIPFERTRPDALIEMTLTGDQHLTDIAFDGVDGFDHVDVLNSTLSRNVSINLVGADSLVVRPNPGVSVLSDTILAVTNPTSGNVTTGRLTLQHDEAVTQWSLESAEVFQSVTGTWDRDIRFTHNLTGSHSTFDVRGATFNGRSRFVQNGAANSPRNVMEAYYVDTDFHAPSEQIAVGGTGNDFIRRSFDNVSIVGRWDLRGEGGNDTIIVDHTNVTISGPTDGDFQPGAGHDLVLTTFDVAYVDDDHRVRFDLNSGTDVLGIFGTDVSLNNLNDISITGTDDNTILVSEGADTSVLDLINSITEPEVAAEVQRLKQAVIDNGLHLEKGTDFDPKPVVGGPLTKDTLSIRTVNSDDKVVVKVSKDVQPVTKKNVSLRIDGGDDFVSLSGPQQLDSLVGVDVVPDGAVRIFTVTNTLDSGPGSLRAAIEGANGWASDGLAIITIAIPDTDPGFIDVDVSRADGDPKPDVFVIAPQSALPALRRGATVLNGQSQHNFTGDTNPFGPEIVLAGQHAGSVQQGLLSSYAFEGDANDVSGHNDPSATSGISFVDGQSGQGVTFAPGGYIDIPHSEDLALQRFTVSAWARADGAGPNNDQYGSVILAKGLPVPLAEHRVQLGWSAVSNRFWFGFGDVSRDDGIIYSERVYGPGEFHHVAGTYDGETFRLFVDGHLEGTLALVKTIVYDATVPWTIGSTAGVFRDRPGADYPRTWNGVLDEIGIYDRALSQAEIQSLSAPVHGLHLASSDNYVHGLNIHGFSGDGILIAPEVAAATSNTGDLGDSAQTTAANNNTVTGNYIGTSAAGTANASNGGNGVHIVNSSSNVIGRANPSLGDAPIYIHTFESNSKLSVVDPNTGSTTLIGNMGVPITDLALADDGTLYAISLANLYTVDRGTGTASLVGSLGVTDMDGLDFSANGALFGVSISGTVYQIDTSTGEATPLFNTPYSYTGDLTHYEGDTFYATATSGGSQLIQLDISSAETIYRGQIAGELIPGLEFTADGRLLAFSHGTGNIYELSDYESTVTASLLSNSSISIAGAATSAQGTLSRRAGNVISGNTSGSGVLIEGEAELPSLVSRWLADGNANDSAGDNDGHLVGDTAFKPGVGGGSAFGFDGGKDYVRVADAPELEPEHVTLSAWINATGPSGTVEYFAAKGADGTVAASYALYQSSGFVYFYIYDGTSFVRSPGIAAADVYDGTWHQLTGTFGDGHVRLYVDGAEVGTGTPTSRTIAYGLPTSNDLTIGRYDHPDLGFNYIGVIDDVVFFNEALSADQVAYLFSTGIPVTGANRVQGNYIGTTADGMSAIGNGDTGVRITDSSGNMIGGDSAELGNLISGNPQGLGITGVASTGNVIRGNLVGTDKTGRGRLDNRVDGIAVTRGATGNIIGGLSDGERNVISGSGRFGVLVANTLGNSIQGNSIGSDVTGTERIANTSAGIAVLNDFGTVIGGTESGAGNVISGNGVGVWLYGGLAAKDVRIEGNLIGTTADGQGPLPNGDGIFILASNGNKVQNLAIGGSAPGAGNVISGNRYGIRITGAEALNIRVQGNKIGTDVDGLDAVPNSRAGIIISDGAGGVTIGGATPAARNIISGNDQDGVQIVGVGNNTIQGNYIGTTADGMSPLGNATGITVIDSSQNLIGGPSAAVRNIVSASKAGHGITIQGSAASSNLIEGNFVGLAADGATALGNSFSGIVLAESSGHTLRGNVSSANADSGVYLVGATTSNNTIEHNYFGTDATGTLDRGNANMGINLRRARSTTVRENLISGNDRFGVGINSVSTGTLIESNRIGTDVTGTAALGNDIGILVEGASNSIPGNVVSGNFKQGVWVRGSAAQNVTIQGNKIGADSDGAAAVPNGQTSNGAGILIEGANGVLVGGTTEAARNVISGNHGSGISISGGSHHTVQGNSIGTTADGMSPLGNATGITVINSSNNVIGGLTDAAGNVIAHNSGSGVCVIGNDSVGNTIRRNSIHSNALLGIDLGPAGITPNDDGDASAEPSIPPDTDSGPNDLQNAPVIRSAIAGNTTRIAGQLRSTPQSTFTIDFYASAEPDPSGAGEGERWLGSIQVTTNELGVAGFSIKSGTVKLGEYVTATATNHTGSTSEFSNAEFVRGRGIVPDVVRPRGNSSFSAGSAVLLAESDAIATPQTSTVRSESTAAQAVTASQEGASAQMDDSSAKRGQQAAARQATSTDSELPVPDESLEAIFTEFEDALSDELLAGIGSKAVGERICGPPRFRALRPPDLLRSR